MAMLLTHRFFARKSMMTNDRFVSAGVREGGEGQLLAHAMLQAPLLCSVAPSHPSQLRKNGLRAGASRERVPSSHAPCHGHCASQVIASACLHLASKMEESPKPIRDLVRECLRARLGHLPPEALAKELELVRAGSCLRSLPVLSGCGLWGRCTLQPPASLKVRTPARRPPAPRKSRSMRLAQPCGCLAGKHSCNPFHLICTLLPHLLRPPTPLVFRSSWRWPKRRSWWRSAP